MNAVQETQVIDMSGDMREQFRNSLSGLPMARKSPQRLHQLLPGHLTKVTETHAGKIDGLAIARHQLRF
jgi:hypothetical protein